MKYKTLNISMLFVVVLFSSMTNTRPKLKMPNGLVNSSLTIFLKLDEIDGSSIKSGHEDEFEVASLNFGVSNNLYLGPNQNELESSNKPNGSDMVLTLQEGTLSNALPMLFLKVCGGEHIVSAEISINIANGSGGFQEIEHIKLNDVILTSVQNTGADSIDGTTETTISLNFQSIERKMYAYNSQTGVWTAGTPVIWNYANNNQTP